MIEICLRITFKDFEEGSNIQSTIVQIINHTHKHTQTHTHTLVSLHNI